MNQALLWGVLGSLWLQLAAPPARAAEPAATGLERLDLKEGWPRGGQPLPLPAWTQLHLSAIGEPMLNPVGGSSSSASWSGQTTLALELNPGLKRNPAQWREIDHWKLKLAVNQYSGDSLYSERIGALFPLQQIAYPSGLLPSELSLSRSSRDDNLQVKAGILSLNPSFIAAPVFNGYVHSAFNNTLNISASGLPISPYASLGGVVQLKPTRELSLRYGWFDLGSTATIARWLGGSPPAAGSGSAQLLQLNWMPAKLGAPPEAALPACRTGAGVVRRHAACRLPVLVQNQLPGSLISIGGYGSSAAGSGLYGSATVAAGLPIGLEQRLWLGGASSTDAPGNLSPTFMAGGLVVQGLLPTRPLDVLVLAAGRASLRRGAVTAWPSAYEAMIELGYQLKLSRTMALQPTLQWILNPSAGAGPLPDILAAGVQLSFSF